MVYTVVQVDRLIPVAPSPANRRLGYARNEPWSVRGASTGRPGGQPHGGRNGSPYPSARNPDPRAGRNRGLFD